VNCDDVRNLLDAYADDELDLATSLEVEQHLDDCAGCAERLQNRRALKQALQSDALYFKAPAKLRKRVQNSLPAARSTRWTDRLRQNLWISMAAAALLGILVTAGLFQTPLLKSGAPDSLAQEVVASHIRSLMADHLSDVVSTDQHTVKPWFDGKLDFAPTVMDLASSGFTLTGGRLDYVNGRPVAALTYRHRLHVVNLFEWPAAGAHDSAPAAVTQKGYSMVHWRRAGIEYWAISDVAGADLLALADLLGKS